MNPLSNTETSQSTTKSRAKKLEISSVGNRFGKYRQLIPLQTIAIDRFYTARLPLLPLSIYILSLTLGASLFSPLLLLLFSLPSLPSRLSSKLFALKKFSTPKSLTNKINTHHNFQRPDLSHYQFFEAPPAKTRQSQKA